jgi:tRNA 2-selenouridine synthase
MHISVVSFLRKAQFTPVIDVRSPAEFEKGHFPGAINIPLFSNKERAIVGTKYKRESRDTAMTEAMIFASEKVDYYLDEIAKVKTDRKEILILCWRGGMRSLAMARLFIADGYKVEILEGGYKNYRHEVLNSFHQALKLVVIGGMTGSGKSDILKEINRLNEQVIDLEKIAHHKGSAFGALGQAEQSSIEQFENDLHAAFSVLDCSKTIWLEDESQLVGKVRIPEPLFTQIRRAKVFKLQLDKELRIRRLLKEYTNFDENLIITSIQSISKKLGGLATKQAIEAVKANDFYSAINIVLSYYDKAYSYGLSKRKDQTVTSVKLAEDNPEKAAKILLSLLK